MFDSFEFKYVTPNSASAADLVTNLSVWNRVNIAPLRRMGCLSCGVHARKKFTATQLRVSLADNYEGSDWTFRIILDA